MDDTNPTIEKHERYVVGAALARADLIDDIRDVIEPGDFRDARLEAVFAAACSLHDANAPVDAVSVADALTRTGDLARVGGMSSLHDLVSEAAVPASAAWHAQRVRDAAVRRAVWAAGTRLREVAAAEVATQDEALAVVDAARDELDKVAVRDDDDVGHEQAVWQSLDALKEPPGTPTPWQPLTKALSGWKPGALYLVGARPATGKSIVGVQAAVDMARRHKAAVLFSLEMTKTEVYHRMLTASAEVDMGRLQNRTLTADDEDALRKAAADIAALPLVVVDKPSVSVAQVRAKVRSEQRRRDVGLVVVDYLGLLAPPANVGRQDRRVQVDAISRSLKALAMELRVPVLAMAQLNRASTARADGMPSLADLRESGGQEQDADVVMLLHRDTTDEVTASSLHMLVAKNRHGPITRMEFSFRGHYSRIDEMGAFTP